MVNALACATCNSAHAQEAVGTIHKENTNTCKGQARECLLETNDPFILQSPLQACTAETKITPSCMNCFKAVSLASLRFDGPDSQMSHSQNPVVKWSQCEESRRRLFVVGIVPY